MVSRLFSPSVSAVLLILVTALLYGQTLRYTYVYEDNNDLGRLERSVFALGGIDGTTKNPINPARILTEISYEFSQWLTPESAMGGHAVNVAWHLVNVTLLFALAWTVLPPWGAVLAAGVFALHPLQVETVAYVASRSELIACSGVLLAWLSVSLGSLTGALVGVVCACLGKESAIMAWALVPLWALSTRTGFRLKPFLLIGGVLAAAGVGVFLSRVTHLSAALDLDHMGRTAVSVVGLTSLVFAPFWQSIDHDWRGAGLWLQSLSVSVIVMLTVASVAALVRGPHWFSLAWLSTLLWFAPRFVVPVSEGLHEHHTYSLITLWALCVGAWLSRSRLAQGA